MSDAPQIDTVAEAPPPPPRPVLRNKGKLARRKPGPPKGFKRTAPTRTAEPRTADDARAEPVLEMAPAPERMPRESGAFEPEYDAGAKRLSREDRDTNQFEIPPGVRKRLQNAGWDWCWKVTAVYGQPVDATELMIADNAGWRPAKAKDFPELVPRGTDPTNQINRHGQRFFIRPAYMTREAQQEDYEVANARMKSRMQETQNGKSLSSDEAGLADMGRVVRPVAISLDVQGEFGSHGTR